MLSVKTVTLALFCLSLSVSGAPIRREVPQEHSHEPFLTSVRASLAVNNPNQISDPVFGLLGNAAAKGGAGKIADPDCLQQATADQAFTNAKAKKDVQGQVDALIYRALERNTGKVGLASVACTSIKAVNPEIAAISQHQDPASAGAAAVNKAIVLKLAQQIAKVGGNPLDALKSGTFKPGNLGDSTAKGNSCDDANDKNGCIFTGKLIVNDATPAEIQAAVKGAGAAAAAPPAEAAPPAAAAPPADNSGAAAASSGAIGNFGSCSVPQIKFGVGFDNRKETSFEPVDLAAFNHGSAQNIDIITKFMCDNLVNKCGADATAKATCAKGLAAADTAAPKTGKQADLFNAAFGLKTNFAAVAAIDNQGKVVAGSTAGGASLADNGAAAGAAAASSGLGNFGKCTVPQIKFGAGFEGRKETSFEPADQKSFNHGSAQNIGVIANAICDGLTNNCGADATAKATCAKAQTAVNGATPKTGKQADLFNAVFGIKTNFAAVAAIDDQGKVIAGSSTGDAAAASSSAADASGAAAAASGVGNFGKCSTPQIKFGAGFEGRKETSFEPADQQSFNHGSAQNIGVITQSICDQVKSKCGGDAAAQATCAKAQAAVNGAAPKTGAQADLFNAAFGIKTNFAAVAAIDDQGKAVAGSSTGDAAAASSGAADASGAAAASSGLGNFGKCSVPQIKFGVGFDGRKENSFEPADLKSYTHGSALNIGVITGFICGQVNNSCGADAAAKATCAKATAAVSGAADKTGGQADLFNAVFGVKTNFAAVA